MCRLFMSYGPVQETKHILILSPLMPPILIITDSLCPQVVITEVTLRPTKFKQEIIFLHYHQSLKRDEENFLKGVGL